MSDPTESRTTLLARARAKAQYARFTPEQKKARQAATRVWRASYPERNLAANKRWRANNPERWRELRRRGRKLSQTKPETRITGILRRRVRYLIKRGAASVRCSATIGCSPSFLIRYLESLFSPGMSWANYGREWEIDHRRPLAAFDKTNPEEFAKANHYTNLQPLWAHENRAKAASIDWRAA